MVIDTNLVPMVITALQVGKLRMRKEAAWAVGNCAKGGTEEQVRYHTPPLSANICTCTCIRCVQSLTTPHNTWRKRRHKITCTVHVILCLLFLPHSLLLPFLPPLLPHSSLTPPSVSGQLPHAARSSACTVQPHRLQ